MQMNFFAPALQLKNLATMLVNGKIMVSHYEAGNLKVLKELKMKIKKLLPLILVFLLGGCIELDFSGIIYETPFLPGVFH